MVLTKETDDHVIAVPSISKAGGLFSNVKNLLYGIALQ